MVVAVKFNPEKVEDREQVKRIVKWYDENDDSVPSVSSATAQTNLEPSESSGVDMATEKQIWRLNQMKYDGDPSKLTKEQASDKIKQMKEGD